MVTKNYIAFEGIDGSGKSLQIKLLCERLLKFNYTPIRLIEPTYGGYGHQIREFMGNGQMISVDEQNRLFTRDRLEHIKTKISPILNMMQTTQPHCGFFIVQDRSYFSAPAYQETEKNSMINAVVKQEKFAPRPRNIFLIDISVKVAIKRIQARKTTNDIFEMQDFLERVRDNYLYVAKQFANFHIIDGSKSPEEVNDEIWQTLNLRRFEPPLTY